MNMSSGLKAYLSLANALLFQSAWIKWMLLGGFVLASFGGILMSLWKAPINVGITISGGVFVVVSILMMTIVLPGQMLAINSSKLISLLPAIRKASLHIVFLFSLICSSAVTLATVLFNNPVVFSQLFLTVFFILSLMLTLSVFVTQRWQRFQFTMFLIFISIKYLFASFQSLSMAIAVGLNFLLWISFSIWWQQWRPTRYLKNIAVMTQAEMIRFHQNKLYSESQKNIMIDCVWKIFKGLEKPAINRADAIRAHLMGANLGPMGRAKSTLLAIALLGVFILICSFFQMSKK